MFGFDILALLQTFGYFGLFFIVFAETGLFIGFFFPGDSLLFAVGILASRGIFNIEIAVLVMFVGAVIGNLVGYWFGEKVGPALFHREDSRFFKKSHLVRASEFYERHGTGTIFLARFVPIVRTFAPIVAGVGKMRYAAFVTYNIVGAFVWVVGITVLGFYLGKKIPNIDKYLLPIIALIIIISVAPAILEYLRSRK